MTAWRDGAKCALRLFLASASAQCSQRLETKLRQLDDVTLLAARRRSQQHVFGPRHRNAAGSFTTLRSVCRLNLQEEVGPRLAASTDAELRALCLNSSNDFKKA